MADAADARPALGLSGRDSVRKPKQTRDETPQQRPLSRPFFAFFAGFAASDRQDGYVKRDDTSSPATHVVATSRTHGQDGTVRTPVGRVAGAVPPLSHTHCAICERSRSTATLAKW